MNITKDCLVVIDYILMDEDGNVIESTYEKEPYSYVHGHEQIIKGVERALEGHEPGDEIEIELEPEDAFGEYDPGLVEMVDRAFFPEDAELEPGTEYIMQDREGRLIPFTIKKIEGNEVYCDFNHPLAGKKVKFKITVREVRQLNPEP